MEQNAEWSFHSTCSAEQNGQVAKTGEADDGQRQSRIHLFGFYSLEAEITVSTRLSLPANNPFDETGRGNFINPLIITKLKNPHARRRRKAASNCQQANLENLQ